MPAIGQPLPPRRETDRRTAASDAADGANPLPRRESGQAGRLGRDTGGPGRDCEDESTGAARSHSRGDARGGAEGSGWFLREVTAKDAGEIAQLEPILFPDEAWDLAMVREEIDHPSRSYVAAADDASGAILGYAGIMHMGHLADLHTIGTVNPSRGIGRALLAWCMEEARAGGAERLLLEVRVDNGRAREFYRRAGFEELGVRRGYYHTPLGTVDAEVMAAQL